MNKYNYLIVLQGDYGFGWEDLTAAEESRAGRAEIRENVKAYRKNEGGSYRVINRREPNPAYVVEGKDQ